MNFHTIRTKFLEQGVDIFSTRDFINILGLTPEIAAVKLSRYKKQGYLTSPRKGVYYFFDKPPDNFVLANKIYNPSYLSLETILSKEGIIPETVYTITSVTTKATRQFVDNGIAYTYSRIKKEAYTGYCLDGDAQIAVPEKALADYLYFVSQGKKTLNDRLDCSGIDKDRCRQYAKLFESRRLNRLIKKIW